MSERKTLNKKKETIIISNEAIFNENVKMFECCKPDGVECAHRRGTSNDEISDSIEESKQKQCETETKAENATENETNANPSTTLVIEQVENSSTTLSTMTPKLPHKKAAEPTEFCKYCKILRIRHNESIKEMAEKMNITPSFLSAVEKGKRTIPSEWLNLIGNVYSLSDKALAELKAAIEESQQKIKFELQTYSDGEKRLILAFFNNIRGLDEKRINRAIKALK